MQNILAIEHMEEHRLRANPINVKVREPESIIIVSVIFLEAKQSDIRGNINGTLISLFILKIEGDSDLGMVFQDSTPKSRTSLFPTQ